MRVLELYAGIGGAAAALEGSATVAQAVDHNLLALQAYRHNFSHPADAWNLEFVDPARLAGVGAELWWMSPPCQPYTRRGNHRDIDDPRARSFLRLIGIIDDLRPPHVAVENVVGFEQSETFRRLEGMLAGAGYDVAWRLLCPSELGIPNRRPRFYLVASQQGLRPAEPDPVFDRPLSDYLDPDADTAQLGVAPQRLERFRTAMHTIRDDAARTTSCFTSAYGKSPVRAGSYLDTEGGRRHFSPTEILRLLHFPPTYVMPSGLTLKQQWKLVGNSVSVAALRTVLRRVPGLAIDLPFSFDTLSGRG